MPETAQQLEFSKVINRWNSNRLDLFHISQPDENLEFHGVVRFFYEEETEGGAATKCLRVSSSSPTRQVLQTLSERFRPDMKMLTSRYALYEVHGDEERKLEPEEKPLVVQLSWNSGNREGRFVLKKDDDHVEETDRGGEKGGVLQIFRRTLSRKGRKENRSRGADRSRSTEDLLNNNSLCWSNPHIQKHEGEELRQPGLPLGIYFCDDAEEAFLSAVISDTSSSTDHFRLSPAFVLYTAARFALQRRPASSSYRDGVASIANKMVTMIETVIQHVMNMSHLQRQQFMVGSLAFWLANSSELLIFLKRDKDLGPLTQHSQLDLSHLVHTAYSFLLQSLRNQLCQHLPTFLIDPERHGALPDGLEMVLNTLMSSMSLLRRCRVNPAFSIQLFSQLFHFISAWLFNKLVSSGTSHPGLRSHYWGSAVRQRLTAIEVWAERQGLELVADYHLGHITQATTLLTMNKYSMEDATVISGTCFRLNSLQLRTLLSGYLYAANEPSIPPGLIDAVVGAAETSADNLIRSEGRDIQMKERLDLQLPLLLPEEGFSCHSVSGVPQGLRDFLEPISQKGLCSLAPQADGKQDWTVHFGEPAGPGQCTLMAAQRQPTVESITLHKPVNSGMGVSIVAAKGAEQENLGIFIRSVVRGGPAEMDGRLAAGDQLLSVDGHSLHGLNQERAAAVMMQTGPVVTLQVAKSGASYHGLQALMGPPAPENTSKGGGEAAPENGQPSVIGGRARREQTMHRSSPNLSGSHLEDGHEPPSPHVKEKKPWASRSSIRADTFCREYVTLPNPKSKAVLSGVQPTITASLRPLEAPGSKQKTFMRQSFSQDNLSVDSERPLLDKRQNKWEQNAKSGSVFSSFPIRCSASAHDILSGRSSPSKPQQRGPDSCAGVWRAPFPQQAVPTVQPIRIDIPVTRAVYASPPLTTFQQNSSRTGRTLHADRQGPWSPAGRVFSASAAPKASDKPQVSITPTKHVSFQEPPPQHRSSGPGRRGDPRGLSDPWRREAREELRKQQRLLAVERLQQEVEELQKKEQRTSQENDRLRRLSLELQFQRRLQEAQRGEEEEEEEEEILKNGTSQVQQNGSDPNKDCERNREENPPNEDEATSGENGLMGTGFRNMNNVLVFLSGTGLKQNRTNDPTPAE
ncbi:afadin [Oryzias latipes]